jgi:hypothetical protein
MPAPKGNKFWLARSSHGRDPIFKTPEALWEAALEYFEWVEENPLFEAKPFHFQGSVTMESVPKMRAMSLPGLTNFLDIGLRTWNDYANRKDFSPVCTRISEIIRQQKFEGASADMLNPAIIARDLGLADKKDHTSSDGSMSPQATEGAVIEQALRLGIDPATLGLSGNGKKGKGS